MRKRFAWTPLALLSPLVVALACGGPGSTTIGGGGDDAAAPDTSIQLDASCAVTVDSPPLLPASHVAIGTVVAYDSNPPSSGPHYPIWAAYQAYATPVPRSYYVHDLEHGAIVLLYNCASRDACPGTAAALEAIPAQLATDPLCDPSVRVRTVVTPDPLLDVPVAAAAWGHTYKADCVDVPTLLAFARAHYAQGPENICGNGTTQF